LRGEHRTSNPRPSSPPYQSSPLGYEQKFAEAFASWESRNPEDPFGEMAVAASYLFEELYLQGVLWLWKQAMNGFQGVTGSFE
jgi:hypothetical protein